MFLQHYSPKGRVYQNGRGRTVYVKRLLCIVQKTKRLSYLFKQQLFCQKR